tara:strand:- start:180 stop:512 length:333 start_codon:yes stop_codon:yes gene_type:complete
MGIIRWVIDFFKGGDSEVEVIPENETPEEKTKREQRQEARRKKAEERLAKVEARRNYRIEKINALKEKIYAVAAKRKWLFFIIAAAIAAYLIVSYTGFGGSILSGVKGLF